MEGRASIVAHMKGCAFVFIAILIEFPYLHPEHRLRQQALHFRHHPLLKQLITPHINRHIPQHNHHQTNYPLSSSYLILSPKAIIVLVLLI